jgi:RND family efflux transporter MFP subunit
MNTHSNPSSANHTESVQAHTGHTDHAPERKPISTGQAVVGLLCIVLTMIVLAVLGILPRIHAQSALERKTVELAMPAVIAAPPVPGKPIVDLVLPGNVTAYTDSPIYSRTPGYLMHWYYDIGAHVKKGALLAVIATPEVDQELVQAEADLKTAEANAKNAKIQSDRYNSLIASHAVSQQNTDIFTYQAQSTAAQVASAQANVQRLKELTSFEKIYAPFNGVVTARNVDIGQLINVGAGNELFHMQAVDTLRVYVSVPQVYSGSAKMGESVGLTFPEHPGEIFTGKVVRTAQAIDPATRTLLVEVDVANPKGELLAGTLAQAHFKVAPVGDVFVLPVSALIFRSAGLQVATERDGVAHLVKVTMGQDDGRTVQINTGLKKDDLVIQDPPDSLVDGEKVRVLTPAEVTAAQGGF